MRDDAEHDDAEERPPADLTDDERAFLDEMPALPNIGPSRREFLGQAAVGGLGPFALDLLAIEGTLELM